MEVVHCKKDKFDVMLTGVDVINCLWEVKG